MALSKSKLGSDPNLRGDYSKAAPDYSVEQDWSKYTADEHALYRRLFERQSKLVPRYACAEWIEAIAALDSSREIPRFTAISAKLRRATAATCCPFPMSSTAAKGCAWTARGCAASSSLRSAWS